ncbi:hypothetical protein V3W47_04080 [Deinococcus sp. YIM 134068]|uniref:hypothetical protein n=1 Tax=Deinococcus lichenicola TaxID=3118910 RepID=UPI002F93E636
MTTQRKRLRATAVLSAALVVAGGWTGVIAAQPPSSPSDTRLALRQTARYADGTYTARGWYGSLPSSITVTVTLARGVITRASVRTHATDPTSLDYQRRFAAAVPRVVVGRPVGEVRVGRLAGSSGTPVGFNDALEKIREQASN